MDYDPIPAEDEELAHEIIGAAIELDRVLGPGFLDLRRALIGVASVATSRDWQQSAKRLVDILITGSRPAR
jgi:hypothetical protein